MTTTPQDIVNFLNANPSFTHVEWTSILFCDNRNERYLCHNKWTQNIRLPTGPGVVAYLFDSDDLSADRSVRCIQLGANSFVVVPCRWSLLGVSLALDIIGLLGGGMSVGDVSELIARGDLVMRLVEVVEG